MNALAAEGLVRRFARPGHAGGVGGAGLLSTLGREAGYLTVLDGASLAVSPREAVAIVGPSGSGKSTLLHLLSGLDRPDAGTIHVAGHDLGALNENARADLRNQHLGLVLQQDQLLPQCTALENVLIPTLARAGTRDAGIQERALSLLKAVGLAAFAAHRPAQLSAGQRQRVAVARALIHQPAVLLADEPTGALDRGTSAELLALLLEVRQAQNTALVVVTHDETLARGMDRTLVLTDGRLEPVAP